MKLVIDIGNTLSKAGVFRQKQLLHTFTSVEIDTAFIDMMYATHDIKSCILSSVKDVPAEVINLIEQHSPLTRFSSQTPVPIANLYKSPATLGNDRLAVAVGAHALYPGEHVLVVDAGTCITFDFINDKAEYLGGSISPGLHMRFKALHAFTGKLPLVEMATQHELLGTDTASSILSGVINGVIGEIDAIIAAYQSLYPSLRTLICGGDGSFLAERLKSRTFAAPELVLTGLNEILDYNEL